MAPLSDDDLTLHVLNGLGHNYREITGPIRSRETHLKFAELHDMLVEHELYLKNLEDLNSSLVVTANVAHNTRGGSNHQSSNRVGSFNHNRNNSGRGGSYNNCGNSNGPLRGKQHSRGRGGPSGSNGGRPHIVVI